MNYQYLVFVVLTKGILSDEDASPRNINLLSDGDAIVSIGKGGKVMNWLPHTNLSQIRGLVFDHKTNMVYIVTSPYTSTIWQFHLTKPDSLQKLIDLNITVNRNGMTLDRENNYLYVSGKYQNAIQRVHTNGSGYHNWILNVGDSICTVGSITWTYGYIYWVDEKSIKRSSITQDTLPIEMPIGELPSYPKDISIDIQQQKLFSCGRDYVMEYSLDGAANRQLSNDNVNCYAITANSGNAYVLRGNRSIHKFNAYANKITAITKQQYVMIEAASVMIPDKECYKVCLDGDQGESEQGCECDCSKPWEDPACKKDKIIQLLGLCVSILAIAVLGLTGFIVYGYHKNKRKTDKTTTDENRPVDRNTKRSVVASFASQVTGNGEPHDMSSIEITPQLRVPANEITSQLRVSANETASQLRVSANESTSLLRVSANETIPQLRVSTNETASQLGVSANETSSQLGVSPNETGTQLRVSTN